MTFVPRIRRLGLVAAPLLMALAAISPAIAADVGVSLVGKTFDPPDITVAQGDTVTWTVTQSMGEPHTVTSGFPSGPDQGSVFDSRTTDPDLSALKENGGTFAFTFDTPGTYLYFCTIHSTMRGQVVVLAPGQSAPPIPTATPEATTTATAAATATAATATAATATAEPAGPTGTTKPSEPAGEGIAPERKLIGAAILVVTLVVLFGAAIVYRRMNSA